MSVGQSCFGKGSILLRMCPRPTVSGGRDLTIVALDHCFCDNDIALKDSITACLSRDGVVDRVKSSGTFGRENMLRQCRFDWKVGTQLFSTGQLTRKVPNQRG